MKNKYGIKVGDIFYNSWGYDQTNVDFYQVVRLSGESTVILRKIESRLCEDEGDPSRMYGKVSACKDKFIENAPEFKKRLISTTLHDKGWCVSWKYGHGDLTNENEKHFCSWYA